MKFFKPYRGFTLIELIVVVAIVGLLAAITLAATDSSRSKSKDTAIKANLRTLQNQAEVYYYEHGNAYVPMGYSMLATCPLSGTTMFAADSTIKNSIMSANVASNGTISGSNTSNVFCGASSNSYVVEARLVQGVGGSMYWCIDSLGSAALKINQMPAGSTACSQFN